MTYGEQIEKLRLIANEKSDQFTYYGNEVEIEKEEGFVIHQNLLDKLTNAENEIIAASYNYNKLLAFCHKNKIDYDWVIPHQ